MRKLFKMLVLLTVLILFVKALPASAETHGPVTLTYSNLVTGTGTMQFELPKFDPSLGSLKAVHIALDFSGTLVGTAVGVTQAASIDSTVTHWVFFDFMDISDNLFIAEPTLNLRAVIPDGAQNATLAFGPEFLSTSRSFSITSADSRFEAWANGLGTFNGTLRVFFTNTALTFWGLQFYPGSDGGVYSGWISIAYEYVPLARDNDGDGVLDEVDECPNTPPGAVVDEHGCSIAQLVLCDGPRIGGLWKNHAEYVNAIADEVERFLAQGRITQREAKAIVEAAAKSDCGRQR